MLNCSPFLDRVLLLIKPFMKSEVFNLIHFHLPNSRTLDAFVPRELLPDEYGGRAGRVADLKRVFVEQVQQHRDYLMDETRWRSRDAKNRKQSHRGASLPIEENFQTLCID